LDALELSQELTHLVAAQSDELETPDNIFDAQAYHRYLLAATRSDAQVPLEYILDALVRLLVPLDEMGRMATKLDALP
jgi:hypothetical protein